MYPQTKSAKKNIYVTRQKALLIHLVHSIHEQRLVLIYDRG